MRAQSSESAKHVSSKNELCSEYGTPKSCADAVEPRAGRRCVCVNSRWGGRARTEAIEGVELVPAGGEYLRMRWRDVSARAEFFGAGQNYVGISDLRPPCGAKGYRFGPVTLPAADILFQPVGTDNAQRN
jgi:hypothetical protein